MSNIKFNILYDIKLHHPHYVGARCKALKIRPTMSCLQLLKGHGLMFKPYKGGAAILGELTKDINGNWVLKNPISTTEPIKFTFIIEMDKDFGSFEKATYLDDFVLDNNDVGVVGKRIYYFDNLRNNTAEIRRSINAIELSNNNIAVNKQDRVYVISETLKLKPSISGQGIIKFKKVKNAPHSERQLASFLLEQKKSITFSMTELYRKVINQGVINENEKTFPIIPSGLYNIEGGGNISKIYIDETINFQNVWGIIELFENKDASSTKVEMKITFKEKDALSRFNDIDKGVGGYPVSDFYDYFDRNDNAYKESVKYPDF